MDTNSWGYCNNFYTKYGIKGSTGKDSIGEVFRVERIEDKVKHGKKTFKYCITYDRKRVVNKSTFLTTKFRSIKSIISEIVEKVKNYVVEKRIKKQVFNCPHCKFSYFIGYYVITGPSILCPMCQKTVRINKDKWYKDHCLEVEG